MPNTDKDFSTFQLIRFWILLPLTILSLFCCIFLLHFFLKSRKIRRALNNHIVIVIITIEFVYLIIDVPLYLNYLRLNQVWPQLPSLCLLWWFSNNCLHETITVLLAWATFERHILVFHHHQFLTRKKQIFLHYLPMIFLFSYSMIFHLVIIYFPFCEHSFDYTQEWCSIPCPLQNYSLFLFETIFNDIIFTFLIVLFSVTLLLRLIRQKFNYLHHQHRKNRKMIIQVLALAIPYSIFHLPEMFLVSFRTPSRLFEIYLNYLSYFAELSVPFICLAALQPKPWGRRNQLVVGSAPVFQHPMRQMT